MTNPLAHLVAQAETGLADLSRRAVESVTIPVREKSQALVAEVTASVKASVKAIVIKAVLGLFAVVMGIIALGFALSALHTYLSSIFGPIEATLIMAGVFLALAIVAIVVMMVVSGKADTPRASSTASIDASAVVRDADAAADRARAAGAKAREATGANTDHAEARIAEAAAANPLADMKLGLGAVASALGEAGFRREQAGLRAGLAIAEQLKPMQIVSLVLLGGFLAGVRHRRRR